MSYGPSLPSFFVQGVQTSQTASLISLSIFSREGGGHTFIVRVSVETPEPERFSYCVDQQLSKILLGQAGRYYKERTRYVPVLPVRHRVRLGSVQLDLAFEIRLAYHVCDLGKRQGGKKSWKLGLHL